MKRLWMLVLFLLTALVFPFALVWLEALATERGWLDSPSSQIEGVVGFARDLVNNQTYRTALLISVGAVLGSVCTLIFNRYQQRAAVGRKLEVAPDSADAASAVANALERIRGVENAEVDERYNAAVAAVTSAAVSLKKLGIPVLRLDHKNRTSYLKSQQILLQALQPLLAAGHIEEARAISAVLEERLAPLLLEKR